MHILRELRCGVHLVAVVATGLGPRSAVFATGGETLAKRFGWGDNYDDLAGATKKPTEDITDEILTRLYSSVLTDEEVAELAKLVVSMRAHADTYVAADG